MLIACPPIAAMFFQGTLSNVATMYSQFGAASGQARDPAGNPVGSSAGYSGAQATQMVKAKPDDHYRNGPEMVAKTQPIEYRPSADEIKTGKP